MNLAKNLEQSAFFFPNHPVICENDKEISYARFNEQANRVATALIKSGIQPGDHVGLCAPNSADWMAFYFGAIKMGAVAITFSSLLKPTELRLLVGHAKPRIILAFDNNLNPLKELQAEGYLTKIICNGGDLDFNEFIEMGSSEFSALDRDREDTAAILYTGGTTGVPKGVMLSHENINTSIQNVVFLEKSNENDRALLFLPCNHVFGQMHIMNATILSAGCLEMIPSFDLDRVLEILAKGKVTKLFSVPTVYIRLLTVEGIKEKLGAVRYCFSAAASMASETVNKWKEVTGLKIYEAYGMTETAPMVSYNHIHQHVVGSVGTAASGVEIQIRDTKGNQLQPGEKGEICIRGRNVMKGYLDNPEATRAAFWEGGWFRSGDIGYLDNNGYLFIADRLKDMIITGGENVYSLEVEDVIYKFPGIQECVVIGLPDAEWGERVTACIIPEPEASIDPGELEAYMKQHLSAFKVPKEFRIVKDFPKSQAGKILKRELRSNIVDSLTY